MNMLLVFRQNSVPIILIALLMLIAYFFVKMNAFLLVAALLFFPFIDKKWKLPVLKIKRLNVLLWLACFIVMMGLLLYRPEAVRLLLIILFLVALPEEWFFRGYLLRRLQQTSNTKAGQGMSLRGNIISSIVFSLLHAITRSVPVALEVFIPSILFGWLYQKTNDLILCIFLHAISNVIYIFFLENQLSMVRELLSY